MTAVDSAAFGAITDEEIARVRGLIGEPLDIEPWNGEASYDTIRHWAYGIGDDNPLWMDEAYAAQGPYGAMVAPPSFLFSIFGPSIRPGFPGLPSVQGGGRLEIDRYVRRGERLVAEARLTEVVEKRSPRVGRIVLCVGETTYRTTDGERVGAYISRGIRIPRPSPGTARLYEPRTPHRYSAQELAAIEAEVLAQTRTGARPLRWEEVAVGDVLPARVKGPLDAATMACFHAGLGPIGYAPSDLAIKRRHALAAATDRLPSNVPDPDGGAGSPAGDGHDNAEVAHSAGMPGAFDIGWQRVSWLSQTLTDWAGDHGRLKMIDVRLASPNIVGDTMRCRAKVSGKRIADGEYLVDLAVEAERQDGVVAAFGTGTVMLAGGDA